MDLSPRNKPYNKPLNKSNVFDKFVFRWTFLAINGTGVLKEKALPQAHKPTHRETNKLPMIYSINLNR